MRPAWNVTRPFVQRLHAVDPPCLLVALSVIRQTVTVPQCCVGVTLISLQEVPRAQEWSCWQLGPATERVRRAALK